jgi:hypothetical protein
MADTKITALTALTAADPANDVIPIVDVSDTSMAASGTTKKISVNNILGASGTATLASATITGDLTVDTSTLKVDSTNNRVGVLTASPLQSLDVASGNLQVRTGGTVYSDTFSNYGAALAINALGSLPIRLQIAGTNAYEITSANIHQWSNVGGVAGTAMTLNSTGLGVGVTPSAWVLGKALEIGQLGNSLWSPNAGDFRLMNNAFYGSGPALKYAANGFAASYKTESGQHIWLTAPSGIAGNTITFTQAMTLDASGNLILLSSNTPATLATNGQLTVNATSNTNLRFSYRGSDGTTRVANITLA